MKGKGMVSWNTMISGYFRNDSAKEAVMVFREMVDGEVEADRASVLLILLACGYLKNLEVGAIKLCQMMQIEGVRPNEVTLASLLAACTNLPDLRLGRCLRSSAIRHKLLSMLKLH
ncbi:Hypothetical predicted protein [Olea europaea subsp. europaea]|uniref:Pentatricopeptide repeat-containing protein n=1 Tax=Olea europaea subsp. europaea TaxID=158383 RepID=A0A8S0P6B8_OLEEU|nr:Hypothetical predicted protein [Olea europaea subsp. europaea]